MSTLIEHRGRLVAKYRVNPQVWPDGIDSPGDRWYKPEDWGPTDEKGIARPVNTAIVNKPEAVNTEAVNTEAVNTAKEALDRAAYMREYMRKRRELAKAAAEIAHAAHADD